MLNQLLAMGLLSMLLVVSSSAGLAAEPANADGDCQECGDCHCQECSDCWREDGHVRAGCPQCVAWYARPVFNPLYIGYYVGGGAAFRGEPRCPHEGTWGRDYAGILSPPRVWLGYWHGRRVQSGGGAYKTDGPHLRHGH